MKILYLITKSEAGGAQTHIYQLSKYFIEKGNEVGIISYPGGWLEDEARKLGVKFYPNKYFSNIPDPIRIFKVIKEIRKVVEDFKPDLISCHGTAAGFLSRLTIRNKIPTVFTAHGWGFTEGVSWLRRKLVPLAEKIVSRYCKKIICVSNFDKELALKYRIASPNKITVIHNGVETSQNNTDSYAEKRGKEIMKIVFVGRLAQPKDPLLLLKAFNSLSSELKNRAQISIIGEGEKRKELERFIEKNKLKEKVQLLGGLPREKVFEVLQQSDIFVLTSNWEGFPITILEAMSCGLPVIASDVGGVKEVVNEEVGYLVKRGDREGLKKALVELIENPKLIEEKERKARERVEKEFSLGKMLEETEKIYQSLILF